MSTNETSMSTNKSIANSTNKRRADSVSNRMSNRVNKRRCNSMSNTSYNIWVGRSSIIDDLSNISIQVIGMIIDMLDPSIRKIDRVGSLSVTTTIFSLLLTKLCSRIFIRHSILEGVGRGLSEVSVANTMTHSMTQSSYNSMSQSTNNTMSQSTNNSSTSTKEATACK